MTIRSHRTPAPGRPSAAPADGARAYKVAPVALFPLVDELAAQCMDAQALCRGLGFRLADLQEPRFLVSHYDACQWIRRALQLLRDPQLGFNLGLRSNIAHRGLLALGFVSAQTLGDAVSLSLRHPVTAGYLLDLDQARQQDRHVVTAAPMFGNADLMPFLSETLFTDIVQRWRLAMQMPAYRPQAVELRHAVAPQLRRVYERYFGCPVRIHAAEYRLVSEASWLDFALPLRSVPTHRLVRELLDELGQDRPGAPSIETAALRALRRFYGQPAPSARVAAALNVSERTLRRKLADAGTSFRRLLDECRADRSLDLIAEDGVTLKDLAERTGFANVSSLRRAFKRWTGRSMAEYRASVQPARTGGTANRFRRR